MISFFCLILVHSVLSFQNLHHETFLKGKCQATCLKEPNVAECMKVCKKESWVKPGKCPDELSEDDIFESACLKECDKDSTCMYTRKCCPNKCGVTCQLPKGLLELEDLPPIISDLELKPKGYKYDEFERRSKNNILITWSDALDISAATDVIVLEACSHAGHLFSPLRLSEWTEWPFSYKIVKGRITGVHPKNLKYGFWYKFRLATVNKYGSRGFSNKSSPYTPHTDSQTKLPPPIRLHTELIKNNSARSSSWMLTWQYPKDSFLPITKYKVYWSKRLFTSASVLVRHDMLPASVTNYTLNNLEPHSQYFLQVQAISKIGNERFRSERANYVLNTTITET